MIARNSTLRKQTKLIFEQIFKKDFSLREFLVAQMLANFQILEIELLLKNPERQQINNKNIFEQIVKKNLQSEGILKSLNCFCR